MHGNGIHRLNLGLKNGTHLCVRMLGHICVGCRMVPSNSRCPGRAEERVVAIPGGVVRAEFIFLNIG